MSDIVNPRIESYYLHPKKYAWRSDKEIFCPDQGPSTPEEENIASVIKERFKMVISSNYSIHSEVEKPTAVRSHTSQEAPLDFSVKTVVNGPNTQTIQPTNTVNTQSESSKVRNSNTAPPDSELYFNSSDKTQVSVAMHNAKVLTSPAQSYNGSSVVLCHKQRNLKDSSSIPHAQSDTGSGNGFTNHTQFHDSPLTHNGSLQLARFENSTQLSQDPAAKHNDEAPLAKNELTSPRNTPKISIESSPDHSHYKSSILHDALARNSEERMQAHKLASYTQRVPPSSTCTKSTQGSMTPPFMTTSSNIPPTPMTPDNGSVLPNANALIPGPNPLLPGTFTFFNNLGFAPAAMAGMNPYANGNILSPVLDNRIPSNQNPVDKKLGKPVRPFKAITNELLYGIPTIGLPNMNPLIPNGGYFRDYIQGPTKESPDIPKANPAPKRDFAEVSVNSAINSSPPCSSNGADHKLDVAGSGDSNCSYADGSNSVVESAESTSNSRKRSRTLPDDMKDEAYWERRRKNNQAAKRSRDARRQKEDMVAQQAWLFREQNIQLRFQLTGLEEQHQRLQLQFRAVTEQCRNLELQLRLANEKLSRNRCGKCGSRTDIDESNYAESNKND